MDTDDFINDDDSEKLLAQPSVFVYIFDQVAGFFVSFGWYLVGLFLIFILYGNRIQDYLNRRYREQSEKEYEAKCKKDPDWLQQRQKEMEAARKKMQEELDRKAAEHAAKLKEKEEQRNAVLASNAKCGNRLGYGGEAIPKGTNSEISSNKQTKKPYRPEYNPLMGSGGSGGYRPPRRGCPGGGCG